MELSFLLEPVCFVALMVCSVIVLSAGYAPRLVAVPSTLVEVSLGLVFAAPAAPLHPD
jgi:hypothetical protein